MRKKDVFIGLLFILAAALVVMSQFGFFSGIGLFDIVITCILAGIFIKNLIHANFFGIFFPLAFALIIYDEQLKITDFTPWPALLTALLLSVGFSMIFKRPRQFTWNGDITIGKRNEEYHNGSKIYCSTFFGDCIKYVNSQEFEKADLKTNFGDIKVYFDKALVPSGRADINVNVSFGDIELYIPSSWKLINETNTFFGELNISDRLDQPITTEIVLHGNINFGDVTIKYVN